MNNLQFSVSTNEQLLLPLPPYYYFNPFLMQELLVLPYWSGTQALYQHQYPSQYPSRAPSLGPSRYQHGRRFRRMEPQYTSYQLKGESSGRIKGDHSTGIRPGQAWIRANFNTGVGEVWRTPSKNPFTVDRNLT